MKKRNQTHVKVRGNRALEQELVEQCKAGNQDSYRALFDMFKDRVYATALRMFGNEQDAEDATQEIFIKIFKNIHNFRGEASLVTWIYRITVNTCLDVLRIRNRRGTSESIETVYHELSLSDQVKPTGPVSLIIEKKINELPPHSKTVPSRYYIPLRLGNPIS